MSSKDISSFTAHGSILQINADQFLIGWGERTWFEKNHESEHPFFYFPDFFLSHPSPWFQHKSTAIVRRDELIDFLPNVLTAAKDKFIWQNDHKEIFKSAVQELHILFSRGELKKAVPYVFEYADSLMSQAHLTAILKKMITYTHGQPLHLYGFWDKTEGILGASPEILFNYKDDYLVETLACAGTKNNLDLQHHFIKNPKELQEHQIVIDGIKESLAQFGCVKIGETQILKLPKLSHLITPIELEVTKKMDILELIKALHPTPALGAFPKTAGMEWLKSYQKKVPRELYGAPLGYVLGKEAKCVVGIRNIQWASQKIKISAGCGVIPESHFEKEWEEVGLKLASIKDMMGL